MGSRWVVQVLAQNGYANVEVWSGESLWRAVLAMWRAKRGGAKYIRLEWRP